MPNCFPKWFCRSTFSTILPVADFLISVNLMWVRRCLVVILICICLISSEAEHLLRDIPISSSLKRCFMLKSGFSISFFTIKPLFWLLLDYFLCLISQLLINFRGKRGYYFRHPVEVINKKQIWQYKSSGLKYLFKYFEVLEYIRA